MKEVAEYLGNTPALARSVLRRPAGGRPLRGGRHRSGTPYDARRRRRTSGRRSSSARCSGCSRMPDGDPWPSAGLRQTQVGRSCTSVSPARRMLCSEGFRFSSVSANVSADTKCSPRSRASRIRASSRALWAPRLRPSGRVAARTAPPTTSRHAHHPCDGDEGLAVPRAVRRPVTVEVVSAVEHREGSGEASNPKPAARSRTNSRRARDPAVRCAGPCRPYVARPGRRASRTSCPGSGPACG